MKKQAGFTLVELMITVAIIAILGAIAYPSYTYALVKARRADAMGALVGLSSAMERYYTTNNSYTGATILADGAGTIKYNNISPIDGGTAYYNLSIQTLAATSFTVRASPVTSKSQNGDGIIELQNTDERGWDRNGDDDTNDTGEGSWE